MTGWRVNKSAVKDGGRAHHGSVFVALVAIACDACGRTMQPGEEFTRGNGGTEGRGLVRDARAHCWGTQRICCRACGSQATGEGRQASETAEPDDG